jgi:hypothetical protein
MNSHCLTDAQALINKDALLGSDDNSNRNMLNQAAWICNWTEDNVQLWVRGMPVFQGPHWVPIV